MAQREATNKTVENVEIEMLAKIQEVGERYVKSYKDLRPKVKENIGIMSENLGQTPPENPLEFDKVLKIIEEDILPGSSTHKYGGAHGYFSYGGGDICSLLANCLQITTATGAHRHSSPTLYEMEMLMCDWYATAIGLPDQFKFSCDSGTGGGTFLPSSTEGLLFSSIAARTRWNAEYVRKHGGQPPRGKLRVMYSTKQAHSQVEKITRMLDWDLRYVASDDDGSMVVEDLNAQIRADKENGIIPTICVGTVGSTSMLSMDDVKEVSNICNKHGVWVHMDAAYAGNFAMLPEFRYLMDGAEFADSVVVAPQKGFVVAPYCSCTWYKDWTIVHDYIGDNLTMDKHFYKYLSKPEDRIYPSHMNLRLPTFTLPNSLAMWMSISLHGISGLQENLRQVIRSCKLMHDLISSDSRFEIVRYTGLPLVCFRLKAGNKATKDVVHLISHDKRIGMQGSEINGLYFMRMVTNLAATDEDIKRSWGIITDMTEKALKDQ